MKISWKEFTWICGFVIVFVVLLLFAASVLFGLMLDVPITLALLGIGSGLMGVTLGLSKSQNNSRRKDVD
jgi:hypothetical protein